MTASNQTISLCMIVKDEEANLARCLKSVKGVADEVIIVDTGSRDNTVPIAKSFGANLYFHKWEDNFAIPRNIAIDKALGNWILILDADETLDQDSIEEVKRLTKRSDVIGFRVLIQLHPGWTEMKSVRLFRNLPTLRFTGVYHEELQVSKEMQHRFIDTGVKVIHKPFSPSDFNKKYERNMRMLKKHISLYPNSIYQMLDLSRIYLETNSLLEAEKTLNKVLLLINTEKLDEEKYKFYLINYYKYKVHLLLSFFWVCCA
jgi:glycosyltransferase involved in cell wall biosynthesis